MQRDLKQLHHGPFDVVVIGGGIFGACAAWDAAQRGLTVALIERGDFGAATSANSFRILHGGIRYLQHGDLVRVRRSCAERCAFLRIAPHLVRPLPIVVPTYGHGKRGRALLRAGMAAYDALTPDRNAGISDSSRHIPRSRMVSRAEALAMFPDLDSRGLTGAGVFADGQILNPSRLVLAIVKAAASRGAVVANYVEVNRLLGTRDRVTGVAATDVLDGSHFDVQGRVVINAAGPFAEDLLRRGLGLQLTPAGTYSRDACFVVSRPWLHDDRALAVQAATHDPDAIVSRGARHLFFAPWRGSTVVGTWHKVHKDAPESIGVSDAELDAFVAEANAGYPAFGLRREEIAGVNAGLVPFGQNEEGSTHLRYGHRSRLVDHQREHGIAGLITLIGVRFTTGRRGAERAVDAACAQLGRSAPGANTATTPVAGGDIANVAALVAQVAAEHDGRFERELIRRLVLDYGTDARAVLALGGTPGMGARLGESATLAAQVHFGVREEMAMTLADVVLRRTELGLGAHPGAEALRQCAEQFGSARGVTASEVAAQLENIERHWRHRFLLSGG